MGTMIFWIAIAMSNRWNSAPTLTPFGLGLAVSAALPDVPEDELQALVSIAWHESKGNVKALNPRTQCYGLFQFAPTTWKRYGGKTNDVLQQIRLGYAYCRDRYDTAVDAWRFQRATVQKNPALAASRHQSRAKQWIRRGYRGY